MKYFILVILLISVFAVDYTTLFEVDLSNQNDQLSQFQAYQETHYAQVAKDSLTNEDAISFTQLTKYAGIITTDWITSSIKQYRISIWFRGDKGKRTGGFIAYERQDAPNILRPLALDADQPFDFYYQQQFLETADGTWTNYFFYLEGMEGIKIYLEQGQYFGLEDKYYCAFKDLIVTDIALGKDCPGDPQDKILKSYVFGKLFADNNFKGTTIPACVDNGNIVDIRFEYKYYTVPCIETAIFALDQNKKVIEKFAPSKFAVGTQKYILTYNLSLSELNDYNCVLDTTVECQKGDCESYKCMIELYFYLDYKKTFTTRQEEYDWVSENSYAVFYSFFQVLVNKQTETSFSTLIQTLVTNQICGPDCYLDMKLALELYYKNSNGQYVLPKKGEATELTWGDKMNFKIVSTPSDYNLDLKKIFVQTAEQQAQDPDFYIQLGDIFINSFVENIVKSTKGEITFSMMASAEAGLKKGKPFNLKFLVHSSAGLRMLAESASNQDLPAAQASGDSTFILKEYSNKLGFSLLFLVGLFLFLVLQ